MVNSKVIEYDPVKDNYFLSHETYSKFPEFHAVMTEDSGQSVLTLLECHILPINSDLTVYLRTGIN